jgi:hypothetical protein
LEKCLWLTIWGNNPQFKFHNNAWVCWSTVYLICYLLFRQI